MQGYVAQIGD